MLPRALLALSIVLVPATLLPAAEEKRELLSSHQTVAVFEGVEYRLCRGRTALCPDRCGHSGEFATFAIRKYLAYEKPGQYGDPQQKSFLVQVSDHDKQPQGDPAILKTVRGLAQGDHVLLSWRHDYVTKAGASFPERPITKLQPISKEKAEQLMSGAATDEAGDSARVTGAFVLPKELESFDGRTVEIRLYRIHPMIADKAADLVDKVEIEGFAHAQGTETRKTFVIGADAKLEKEMKYYLTLFILRDGQRTHIGEAPGKDLCTVLTHGSPREVTLTVRAVR